MYWEQQVVPHVFMENEKTRSKSSYGERITQENFPELKDVSSLGVQAERIY